MQEGGGVTSCSFSQPNNGRGINGEAGEKCRGRTSNRSAVPFFIPRPCRGGPPITRRVGLGKGVESAAELLDLGPRQQRRREIARVVAVETRGPGREQALDEHRLARQPEGVEELAQRVDEGLAREVERLDVGLAHVVVVWLELREEFADLLLVQAPLRRRAGLLAEEPGHARGVGFDQVVLLHELDGARRADLGVVEHRRAFLPQR